MAEPGITILTVSMPGREQLLAEAVESVEKQVVQPYAHLIRVAPPVGEPNPHQLAVELNVLLEEVQTEWVAILEDDDIFYPNHLVTLSHDIDIADVVYSYGKGACQEDALRWPPHRFLDAIETRNFLPYCAAVKTQKIRDIGGYGGEYDFAQKQFTETGAWAQDWDLWIRLARKGAIFRCVPIVTWAYRQGPHSMTRSWMG